MARTLVSAAVAYKNTARPSLQLSNFPPALWLTKSLILLTYLTLFSLQEIFGGQNYKIQQMTIYLVKLLFVNGLSEFFKGDLTVVR